MAGVLFGLNEELMLVVSGVLAVAANGRAMVAVVMVVVVVAVALEVVEAGLDVALAGSNASPWAAVGKLHFRPSQPILEQWCP